MRYGGGMLGPVIGNNSYINDNGIARNYRVLKVMSVAHQNVAYARTVGQVRKLHAFRPIESSCAYSRMRCPWGEEMKISNVPAEMKWYKTYVTRRERSRYRMMPRVFMKCPARYYALELFWEIMRAFAIALALLLAFLLLMMRNFTTKKEGIYSHNGGEVLSVFPSKSPHNPRSLCANISVSYLHLLEISLAKMKKRNCRSSRAEKS